MAKKVQTKKRTPVRRVVKRVTTTALAKRPAAPVKKPIMPDVLPPEERNLDDGIMLGRLGLVDMKLKPEEEAVLNEPVNVNDIQVKPTGQPYLSHPYYTRLFNRAFGRLGWALVPVSKPSKAVQGKKLSVVVPYVLYIHGQPVAFAQGEQDYYEDNNEQTFGDALEATVASGLRRCAKRIGVGLEMWDRRYLEAFAAERAVCVQIEVKKRGSDEKEKKWVWRLKGSKPFYNEVVRASRHRDEDPPPPARTSTVPAEQRTTNSREGEKITLPQRQRLAMIVNNSARSDEEVNDWLRRAYGIRNDKPSRDILVREYDAICRALESPGVLPEGRAK